MKMKYKDTEFTETTIRLAVIIRFHSFLFPTDRSSRKYLLTYTKKMHTFGSMNIKFCSNNIKVV